MSISKGNRCIWINYNGIDATEECHYEINAEKNGNANHDGNHLFVEIHFEGPNWEKFAECIKQQKNNDIEDFNWLNQFTAFRLREDGFDINEPVDDAVTYIIDRLKKLDEKIGDVIKQTLNAIRMKKEIEEYKKILETKKNIILQGAPGVGKTYTTAALALSICGVNVPDNHDDVMKRNEELRKEG